MYFLGLFRGVENIVDFRSLCARGGFCPQMPVNSGDVLGMQYVYIYIYIFIYFFFISKVVAKGKQKREQNSPQYATTKRKRTRDFQ